MQKVGVGCSLVFLKDRIGTSEWKFQGKGLLAQDGEEPPAREAVLQWDSLALAWPWALFGRRR